jgi:cytochrome P450
MSSWIMHHNEDIFPDPEKFDPERWMDPDRAKSLDKYVISFGKGSRACVGMP